MLFLPVTLSFFLCLACLCGAAYPVAAAVLPPPAPRDDSTGTYFYVKALKGSVNWKSDELDPRGNITFTARLPFAADDLSFLEDVSIPYLIIIRSKLGEATFSPGVFSCNADYTVARAKTNEDGIKSLCKLKLKNGFLFITLRGKNGYDLPQGFGVTSDETKGWLRHKVTIEFVLLYGGHSILGSSEAQIRYSTKAGRKTKVK